MVIAYHLIQTAYGCWLPNDPRGGGSTVLRNDILAELGELHFGRKKVQPPGRQVHEFYEKAEVLLKHPLLTFDEQCREEIARAFAEVIEEQRYTRYACAIMPDHVHILIRKHKHSAEEMIHHLKEKARLRLCANGQRSTDHPTWSDGNGWKVFLDHPDDVKRTITYIRKNPLPLRLPIQEWEFVSSYDGWPLHPGHSANSPYVRTGAEGGRSISITACGLARGNFWRAKPQAVNR